MISYSKAGNALLILLGLLFVFHWIVLIGGIPHNLVWAGKIKTYKQLLILESTSIIISSIAIIIVSLKLKYLNITNSTFIINTGMWTLFVLFALNTIGNFTAENPIEKYCFGSLTLVIALLILKVALTPFNKLKHE